MMKTEKEKHGASSELDPGVLTSFKKFMVKNTFNEKKKIEIP